MRIKTSNNSFNNSIKLSNYSSNTDQIIQRKRALGEWAVLIATVVIAIDAEDHIESVDYSRDVT